MKHPHDPKKYLHCAECENSRPDGEHARVYARLSVAVTLEGHLLITCVRHECVVAFLENQKIADILSDIALAECDCGEHKNEVTH